MVLQYVSVIPMRCVCALPPLRFGQTLAPQKAGFRSLFDALQLQACNMTEPADKEAGEWYAPSLEVAEGSNVLYVIPRSGGTGTQAAADGSEANPFTSLVSAVEASRALSSSYKPTTILLREGTHFLSETIHLGSQDSGLTIQNAAGENAVVSGGKPLKTAWKASSVCDGCFEASLSGQTTTLTGLRRDDVREIRARFPNFDPELGSVIDGVKHVHDGHDGWISAKTQWIAEGNDMNGIKGPWPPSGIRLSEISMIKSSVTCVFGPTLRQADHIHDGRR